jgi:serine phosphatase RsbU (regulator of sigma subunit)
MREITQRVRDQDRLRRVLAEKSRIAAALQASMIPPILPDVAGTELASRYEPAGDGSEVGGDFLDVFGLDQQSWAFVLGDVSGKGAEAAAVSAAARYTLRALADPDRGPAETVAEVNAKLLAQTDAERHCTLILGYLRPTDGGTSVTLTLAGHHPPLLLRTTGEVEEVGRPGTALALFDEPELHDTTLVMAPGEVLCAYTDGLVEARQGSDMFGSQRGHRAPAPTRPPAGRRARRHALGGRPGLPRGPAPGRRCAASGQGQRRRSSINQRPTRARGAAGGTAPSVPDQRAEHDDALGERDRARVEERHA